MTKIKYTAFVNMVYKHSSVGWLGSRAAALAADHQPHIPPGMSQSIQTKAFPLTMTVLGVTMPKRTSEVQVS